MREYFQCPNCELVFVPKKFHLNSIDEKKEYDLHNNNPFDPGYRKFLSRLATPLIGKLGSNSYGLDFGSGSGPALSVMLEECGMRVDLFDLYYHNDESVFKNTYDFITATEVVEHLAKPYYEFKQLLKILKTKGYLGIMTKLVIDKGAFCKWHYIQDMTHISFYSRFTFEYIAKTFDLDLEIIGNDVIILRKSS